MGATLWWFLCAILVFSAAIRQSYANIGDFDDTWQKRADEAQQAAMAAYDPDPDTVTDDANESVHAALDDDTNTNSTRRELRRYRGTCMATNPIDRCWRCHKNWHRHRKQLTKCVLGFGRRTVGGRYGRYYIVTDPSDNNLVRPKRGTLRHAVTRDEPLWIVFARSMIIKLSEELIINSYKTIDGRGANVHIAFGAQLTIQYVKHVIIHGIHIHHIYPGNGGMIRDSETHYGFRTRSDGDGISIFGSSNIWIDHVSLYRCSDGLIDIIQGSTAITLSNNHFTRHDHTLLFGASDSYPQDKIMQITVAFNHFGKGLIQRMPRCRFGFFHVLNNDYTHWRMYAIGGSQNPTIISQGNRYIAQPNIRSSHNCTEVTKREYTPKSVWKHWMWRSEGDIFRNGAYFVESGRQRGHLGYSKRQVIKAKPAGYVVRLTRFAGALTCRRHRRC